MEVDCNKIRKDLRVFHQTRKSLGQPRMGQTLNTVRKALGGAVGAVGGVVAGVHGMLSKNRWKGKYRWCLYF